jgi:hypothetical protein
MKTQRELLNELMDLVAANLSLPIRVCASSDELLPDYGWTAMEISRVEISPWYETEDIILTDREEIHADIDNNIADDYQDKSDEEYEKIVQQIYNREVKRVICVYTTPAGSIK